MQSNPRTVTYSAVFKDILSRQHHNIHEPWEGHNPCSHCLCYIAGLRMLLRQCDS